MDILGDALLDYQNGDYTEDITTFSSVAGEDTLPLPYLFRDFAAMPSIEQKALNLCRGTILDIGCGAGSHSLYLQQKGLNATALDSSKGAIETCKLRGIKNCVQFNISDFKGSRFDTLLLLMNGIGIVEKLANLDAFFTHLKSILANNGQIVLDSSDIIYMFDQDDDGGRWLPASKNYYGEVQFTMEYNAKKSKPFSWLYIDFNTLKRAAIANNLNCELVYEGEHYEYLARLTH